MGCFTWWKGSCRLPRGETPDSLRSPDACAAVRNYLCGLRSGYTVETVASVRQARPACVCSDFAEVIWRSSDRFQLCRVLVQDWDGEPFARRLEEWFDG
jgi:hypothetical protein